MRFVLLILSLMMLQSCGTVMEVSDLNTSGIVRKIKKVRNRPEGNLKYLIEVNPEEKFYIWLVTSEKFNIDDTVCIHS